MKKNEYIYIGMDVHKETHTAVLINSKEEKKGTIKIKNNITDFKRLSAYVETFRQNLTPIYGLEDVTHFGVEISDGLIALWQAELDKYSRKQQEIVEI